MMGRAACEQYSASQNEDAMRIRTSVRHKCSHAVI